MARIANFAILAAVAIALLSALFLVYQTIEAERAERAQVRSTSEIMLELGNISHATINAETGARGYLITLDRRYLEPYQVGRAQIGPALDRLDARLALNATPRQAALLADVRRQAEGRFADIDRMVALVEQGDLRGARRLVLTDDGQDRMARLRLALRELEGIEGQVMQAAAAKTARAEGRVLPLLGLVLALLLVALGLGWRLVTRAAQAEAQAAQAAELAQARDRADLLARELNHRVKNMFAVVLAIVRMSARNAPEAKEVTETIASRIHALLTAHEVSQGTLDQPVAALAKLVETTLAPYRSEACPADVAGPDVLLPERQVTPLGLVLHELTTNAVKYGAWAHGGRIEVKWHVEADTIHLTWTETGFGVTQEPERSGFGSLLMTSSARQLGGTVERRFSAAGVCVTITLPQEAIG